MICAGRENKTCGRLEGRRRKVPTDCACASRARAYRRPMAPPGGASEGRSRWAEPGAPNGARAESGTWGTPGIGEIGGVGPWNRLGLRSRRRTWARCPGPAHRRLPPAVTTRPLPRWLLRAWGEVPSTQRALVGARTTRAVVAVAHTLPESHIRGGDPELQAGAPGVRCSGPRDREGRGLPCTGRGRTRRPMGRVLGGGGLQAWHPGSRSCLFRHPRLVFP